MFQSKISDVAQNWQSKGLFKEPKKLIEISGSESVYELYLAAKFFPSLKAAWDIGLSPQRRNRRKGKDEKSALKHCLG